MAFKEKPSTVIAARFALIDSVVEQIVDTQPEWTAMSSMESADVRTAATAIADWLIGCDYMGPDFMVQYRQEGDDE